MEQISLDESPLQEVMVALTELQQLLQTSKSLSQVIPGNEDPIEFFNRLHGVFVRCLDLEDSFKNSDGEHLITLIEVIHDALPCMTEEEVCKCLRPVIRDICRCLGNVESIELTEILIKQLADHDELLDEMVAELEYVVLDTTDRTLITAAKNVLRKNGAQSEGPSTGRELGSDGQGHDQGHGKIPHLSFAESDLASRTTTGINNGPTSGGGGALSARSSVVHTPRTLEISYLPKALTAKWARAGSHIVEVTSAISCIMLNV
jgi:hypothetical protein